MSRPARIVGRRPKLNADQARRVREWASLGTNLTGVARTLGIGTKAVRAYINRVHKRPLRGEDDGQE